MIFCNLFVKKTGQFSILRIQWDPAEYGGIKEVRRMAVDMWVPDMMITNSLENFEVNRQDATFPCIVGHNGTLFEILSAIL